MIPLTGTLLDYQIPELKRGEVPSLTRLSAAYKRGHHAG